jgi:hypothetical protein
MLGGFCAMHTWQYDVLAGSLGTCIAMSTVLSQFAQLICKLATNESPHTLGPKIRSLLAVGEKCPVCEIMHEAERAAMAALVDSIEANVASGVCCLIHFARTAQLIKNDAAMLRFAESQASAVARLADDMHGFVLKFDGAHRSLMSADERSADQRGLAMLAQSRGKNGIVAPR